MAPCPTNTYLITIPRTASPFTWITNINSIATQSSYPDVFLILNMSELSFHVHNHIINTSLLVVCYIQLCRCACPYSTTLHFDGVVQHFYFLLHQNVLININKHTPCKVFSWDTFLKMGYSRYCLGILY